MKRARDLRGPASRDPLSGTWVATLLEFVKWSQGQQPLDPALEAIAKHLGASAVCFARRDRTKSGLRMIRIIDIEPHRSKPSLERSYALEMLGQELDQLKAGAAVLCSEVLADRREPDAGLVRLVGAHGVREIGLICVGNRAGIRDVIEFHFCRAPRVSWATEAASIGLSLSEVYAGRPFGLVEHYLISRSASHMRKRAEDQKPLVLGVENPLGLTRAEWRLCMMIANGLSKSGAAREMGVSENTIRTHLRNVYAKTGHDTFHDLAMCLVSAEEQSALRSNFPQEAA
jgi:DNA-binding CsgD family transcriptional regulator